MNELKGILITCNGEISKVKFDMDHKDFFKHILLHTGGETFDIGDVSPEINKAYGRLCFVVDDNGIQRLGIGSLNKAGNLIYAHKGNIVGDIIVFREEYTDEGDLDFVNMSEEEQDRLYHDFRTTLNLRETNVNMIV